MKRICLYIFALIPFMQIGCVRDEKFTGTASDDGSGTIEAVAALPVDEVLSDLRQQLDAMRNSTRSAAFDADAATSAPRAPQRKRPATHSPTSLISRTAGMRSSEPIPIFRRSLPS